MRVVQNKPVGLKTTSLFAASVFVGVKEIKPVQGSHTCFSGSALWCLFQCSHCSVSGLKLVVICFSSFVAHCGWTRWWVRDRRDVKNLEVKNINGYSTWNLLTELDPLNNCFFVTSNFEMNERLWFWFCLFFEGVDNNGGTVGPRSTRQSNPEEQASHYFNSFSKDMLVQVSRQAKCTSRSALASKTIPNWRLQRARWTSGCLCGLWLILPPALGLLFVLLLFPAVSQFSRNTWCC